MKVARLELPPPDQGPERIVVSLTLPAEATALATLVSCIPMGLTEGTVGMFLGYELCAALETAGVEFKMVDGPDDLITPALADYCESKL